MLSSPILVSLTLFISLPLILLFSPQILPQTYFPFSSEADDLALFRRATTAAHTTNHLATTTNPKPKIAFLFLTNTNLTFAPLWEKFFAGNHHLFNIYIHADPSSAFASPGGVFEGRFIPAKKTHRASPTLIAATRRLLASALLDDPLNQYFALISQHCIPLLSFRFVYNYLFKDPLTSLKSFAGSGFRYRSYIEILSDEPNLYDRYLARGEKAMLPEVPFEAFRVGSQFFVLTRHHAAVVVRDRKLWKKFRLPCVTEEPCYPEEHYFPTLLSMKDTNGCTGFTLTRVNWTGCWDGHPRLYTPPEVSPELIRQLRESNSSYSYLFARKFSPECLEPLMNIADDVIFRD
ncbi:glycosyltransferase BC10-like [Gastrolobium bilobum]|uniref:glycosyltransferase BC10-like n=1 Tax=Gastrolobium bilobum TaxID=150636 RepID=UPI002AB0978D|nr:glycosyltransferase BC10-like [Gastrolobium bilobum]